MNSDLVWITGAAGLIGSELVRSAERCAPRLRSRGLVRRELDLLDAPGVQRLYHEEKPGAIIHCAAVSRSTICEADPALARRTNIKATETLLNLSSDIPFFFFSTDLVFDGEKGNYDEQDSPNPLSVYAQTKLASEKLVQCNPRSCIIRISLTGGKSASGDRGFNEEMKNAWRAGRTLELFLDEYRCPASASVVARAVWELVTGGATGIYHLCSPEKLSRYEIGSLLAARHAELNPKIVAGSRANYKGPPRPKDTSLNCAKIQKVLTFRLPTFMEWLAQDQSGF